MLSLKNYVGNLPVLHLSLNVANEIFKILFYILSSIIEIYQRCVKNVRIKKPKFT